MIIIYRIINNYSTYMTDTYLRPLSNKVIFKFDNQDTKKETKDFIRKYIDKAHDILYNAENIEGESALNDIMNFLFLRLIENKLSDKEEEGKIDLLNKKIYSNTVDEKTLEKLKYFKLSSIINEKLKDIRNKDKTNNDIIKQLGEFLLVHPLTKQMYNSPNFINAEDATTIIKLLKEVILNLDVKKLHEIPDLVGEIYEHFISGYHKTGSKLGQYFTPRSMMRLSLEFIKNDITEYIKDKKEILVSDWCMGTAGWLVTFYNMFKKDFGKKIILSGGEVKPNTFQYALMNIINTTNKLPKTAIRENSLTHFEDTKKYHLILTNPPFKTSFSFKQIKENFENDKTNKIKLDDVYKLKNNSPPVQFLEMCKYKLAKDGICIIVLPYGKLFFGGSDRKTRKYLLENIDIKHIIICPSGIFTHTGIKTCIMIFRNSKGTKEIKISETNESCNEIKELTTLKIEDIKKEPVLSLNYFDYVKSDEHKDSNLEWVEFGKVFTLEKGTLQSSKVEEDDKSDIVFIGKGDVDENKTVKSRNYYDNGLFIAYAFNGNGKCPIRYINKKCVHSDLMLRVNINNDYDKKINVKFVYYYLKNIQKYIEDNYQKGSCNKSLDIKNFNRMKIPIPPIKEQNEMVEQLDKYLGFNEKYYDLIDTLEKNMKLYVNSIRCKETMKFEDICEYQKKSKRNASDGKDEGKYNFYPSGSCVKKIDVFDYEDECIILSSGGNFNVHIDNHFCCSSHNFVVKVKIDNVVQKYLYYYLLGKIEIIQDKFRGATIMNLSLDKLNTVKIEVPSIEKQNGIIKNCEMLQKQINDINKIISFNDDIIKNIFDNIK